MCCRGRKLGTWTSVLWQTFCPSRLSHCSLQISLSGQIQEPAQKAQFSEHSPNGHLPLRFGHLQKSHPVLLSSPEANPAMPCLNALGLERSLSSLTSHSLDLHVAHLTELLELFTVLHLFQLLSKINSPAASLSTQQSWHPQSSPNSLGYPDTRTSRLPHTCSVLGWKWVHFHEWNTSILKRCIFTTSFS